MSVLEKSEEINLEDASLKDLSIIEDETKKFGFNLVLIGGYAARAYTKPRSWRFTKDIDFVTTKKDLTALHGVFKLLEYSYEKTEFGVKGRKKINKSSIELHVSVGKVIDLSTGKEYPLPDDIFSNSKKITIEPSSEENKGLKITMMVAPVEDIVIMKLLTERIKDKFDAIAIIVDSFEKMDLSRFVRICKESELSQHTKRRLESVLVDTKKGLMKKLWREFTGREFVREQEVVLKNKVSKLLEILS